MKILLEKILLEKPVSDKPYDTSNVRNSFSQKDDLDGATSATNSNSKNQELLQKARSAIKGFDQLDKEEQDQILKDLESGGIELDSYKSYVIRTLEDCAKKLKWKDSNINKIKSSFNGLDSQKSFEKVRYTVMCWYKTIEQYVIKAAIAIYKDNHSNKSSSEQSAGIKKLTNEFTIPELGGGNYKKFSLNESLLLEANPYGDIQSEFSDINDNIADDIDLDKYIKKFEDYCKKEGLDGIPSEQQEDQNSEDKASSYTTWQDTYKNASWTSNAKDWRVTYLAKDWKHDFRVWNIGEDKCRNIGDIARNLIENSEGTSAKNSAIIAQHIAKNGEYKHWGLLTNNNDGNFRASEKQYVIKAYFMSLGIFNNNNKPTNDDQIMKIGGVTNALSLLLSAEGLDKFMQSMHWDEFKRPGNVFVAALNKPQLFWISKEKQISKASEGYASELGIIDSVAAFNKLYNAYVDKHFNANNLSDEGPFGSLLFDRTIYNFDYNDFKMLVELDNELTEDFKTFISDSLNDQVKENLQNITKASDVRKAIFYSNQGELLSIPEIESKLSNKKQDSIKYNKISIDKLKKEINDANKEKLIVSNDSDDTVTPLLREIVDNNTTIDKDYKDDINTIISKHAREENEQKK